MACIEKSHGPQSFRANAAYGVRFFALFGTSCAFAMVGRRTEMAAQPRTMAARSVPLGPTAAAGELCGNGTPHFLVTSSHQE
jgi:hypothetical protein